MTDLRPRSVLSILEFAMLSYAIIGASRGIGLEYVRQLVSWSGLPPGTWLFCTQLTVHPQAARQNTTVFAIVRNAARSTHLTAAVSDLKNVNVFEGDVTDYPSLEVRNGYFASAVSLTCTGHPCLYSAWRRRSGKSRTASSTT